MPWPRPCTDAGSTWEIYQDRQGNDFSTCPDADGNTERINTGSDEEKFLAVQKSCKSGKRIDQKFTDEECIVPWVKNLLNTTTTINTWYVYYVFQSCDVSICKELTNHQWQTAFTNTCTKQIFYSIVKNPF